MSVLKTLAIVGMFIILNNSARATEVITVPKSDHLLENLTESFLYESEVLSSFWQGDDGVECGEPTITFLAIDEPSSKIIFDVFSGELAHGCVIGSHRCVVEYTKNPLNDSLLFKDEPVLPTYMSCEQE